MKDLNCDDSKDEERIMKTTWKRIKRKHLTDSFREGALVGKDEYFQTNFDLGYKDGYHKSYDIGFEQGEQRVLQFLNGSRDILTMSDRNLHKELCPKCCKQDQTYVQSSINKS